MNELRSLGKEKLEEAFEKTLKELTGNDYEVDLEQVWPRGPYIHVSFLANKQELEGEKRAS